MPKYIEELRFCFDKDLRKQFRSHGLGLSWSRQYPELFDADDIRLLQTKHQRQYHFLEWLGAILIFEATGYRSLVQKYGCDNHPAKTKILQRVCSPDLLQFLCEGGSSGWPDLFVYREKPTSYFFCEVKGPRDRISSSQHRIFRKLYDCTGFPVRVLSLESIDSYRSL